MKIGSITKTSLLDYPGKLSAVIGTQGCNMCCPWCHNAYLIPQNFTKQSDIIQEKDFLSFLDQRKNFLESVVITGGEPTIQSDLPKLCQDIKKTGLSVKIDTNGTNPDVLDTLISDALVDYLAMDIKTDLDQYRQLFIAHIDVHQILKSIDTIMSSDVPYEFRTTCVSPFVTRENIDRIGSLIKGAKTLFLQKCNQAKNLAENSKYQIVYEQGLAELKHRADSYVVNCIIR